MYCVEFVFNVTVRLVRHKINGWFYDVIPAEHPEF